MNIRHINPEEIRRIVAQKVQAGEIIILKSTIKQRPSDLLAERLNAEGKCRCGRPSAPGRKGCEFHLKKNAEYHARTIGAARAARRALNPRKGRDLSQLSPKEKHAWECLRMRRWHRRQGQPA